MGGRANGRPGGGEQEFLQALEAASRSIRDPVAKLRFIRSSLSKYEAADRLVRTVPFAPVRRALYRWLSLEGLRHLLNTASLGGPSPVDAAARVSLAFSRAVVVGLGVIAGVSAGVAAYRWSRPPAAPLLAAPRHLPPPETTALPAEPARAAGPAAPRGVAPSHIWLVEKGAQWELYSNGLRVDTAWTVKGTPRRYRVFAETGGLQPAVHEEPVGLLFHTSESDVWPLEASYNESLRGSTQGLLRYVQRHRLYHYVIDRFGRVYRVVEEASKANHAGHSVWAHGGQVYLNLNHAFLGLSFETRWEGGRALPITQAQFAAGRALSDHLRQRYHIDPGLCVTHGLTSVNPHKHLIGHHLDWARGFPFEAFGLPDQYQVPAPSVALFGFDYDDDFLKVMEEPWPGVKVAEAALMREAARRGRFPEDLRHERQVLFDRWTLEQAGEEPDKPAARAGSPAVTASTGTSAGPGKVSTSAAEGLQ